ncbi:MAG: class D sortase [Thermoanaerobaculaceae bacterium]|nr:class D sortase [Thermoanaerobaculaceae bacterium]TAM53342.1 MAG: class D sortase [Acidobacteriota bacterium]
MKRFSCTASWIRRGEVALWVIGFSFLGWAVAANLMSRIYQARQERAFSLSVQERGPVTTAEVSPLALATTPELDPLVLGRIEIPRLGVKAIVREGDDDTTLAVAVGHISGTARPGERGNMALAGHRDSFFRPLRDIRRRDTIRIVTLKRSYEYVVDSTEVVGPEDTGVLAPTSKAVLTLVTCYPFEYVGHAPKRFVVRASLVAPIATAAGGREAPPANGARGLGERARR